jgi:hypothetical protein
MGRTSIISRLSTYTLSPSQPIYHFFLVYLHLHNPFIYVVFSRVSDLRSYIWLVALVDIPALRAIYPVAKPAHISQNCPVHHGLIRVFIPGDGAL